MINVRLATEDDKEGWNGVVFESSEATYAHTWEWSEILADCFDVEPLRLVAEDDENNIIGTYSGFLSNLKINRILDIFIKKYRIFESPYDLTWDYGGPCTINGDKNLIKQLVNKVEELGKDIIMIKVSPFNDEQLQNILLQNGYRISSRLTSVIDLNLAIDDLLSNLKNDTKKGLKRSEREGVVVKEVHELEIKDVYDCLNSLHGDLGAYLPPFDFFQALYEGLSSQKMVKFFVAYHEKKLIGCSICLYFNKTCTERYRASIPQYRRLYPDNALVWNSMIDAKQNGCESFDFGGLPSDENNGIYFFKVRWGGATKHVDWYIKNIKFRKVKQIYRLIS